MIYKIQIYLPEKSDGLFCVYSLEFEDVYKHMSGAYRALAFPDFVGLLVGVGLEAYRKQNAPEPRETDNDEAPEDTWD